MPRRLFAEFRHGFDVARHGVVGDVPPHHAGEPLALLGDGPVPAPLQLYIERFQLCPQPFGDGDALCLFLSLAKRLPEGNQTIDVQVSAYNGAWPAW